MLGLVGTNGIGKSTALKILAAKLKPNLGRYKVTPSFEYVFLGDFQYFTQAIQIVERL